MLRVVVVDDSAQVRRSVGHMLSAMAGVSVVGYAEDVASALLVIDTQQPDVVVLDVALRDQGRGMTVLCHVVSQHPHIKVVALSNFTWQTVRQGFIAAGASAYFDKSMESMEARAWIAALVPTADCLTTASRL